MDKYTRGQINEMRGKMKYLIEYDTSKTRDDNKILNEDIQDISRISGAEIDRSKMDKGYLTDLVTIIDEFGDNVIPFWTKILLPTLMKHRGKVSWDRLPVVLLKTLDHKTAQAVVDELWDRYEATVPANERKPRGR